MDLIEYFGVVRRRLWQIFAFTLLLAVLTGIFTAASSDTYYQAELFITTASKDTSQTTAYRYSNYYNEFSANNFNNTIIGWMADPSIADDAYAKAGINRAENLRFWQKFSSAFAAKKRERNNVAISMTANTEAAVKKLADGLFATLTERVARYNEASDSGYQIIKQGESVSAKVPRPKLNILFALMIGLILGVIFVYLYEYAAGKISTANSGEDALNKENLAVIKGWQDAEWQFIHALSKKLGTDHAVLIDFADHKNVIQKTLSSHKLLSFPADADALNRLSGKALPLIDAKTILVFYRLSHSRLEQLNRLKHLLDAEQIQAIAIDA